MKGILYIVTNDINNKVYIGKTYTTLENRWKKHINDTFSISKIDNNKFHNAIAKYGIEHFNISEIGKFNEGELEKKEIEYIAKYDSFHNGYNSTLGGDGTLRIEFSDNDITKIVSLYNSGKSVNAIARLLDVSTYTISNILKSNNIEVIVQQKHEVVCFNGKNDNNTYRFESILEAANYFGITRELKTQLRNFYNSVNKACKTGSISHGYYWRYIEDFNESLIIRKDNIKLCKICGRKLSNRNTSMMCNSCANVKARNKVSKPSKNELTMLLSTMSISEIAKKYNRSESTIRYWIKLGLEAIK